MKKKFIFPIISILLAACIIYTLSFVICKYWNYTYEKEVYLVACPYDDSYGTINNDDVIDWTLLRSFDGLYVRTKYNSIEEIKTGKNTISITLNHPFNITELYIVYPEMTVFTIYKESIYTKEIYDDTLLYILQRLYIEQIAEDKTPFLTIYNRKGNFLSTRLLPIP